MKPIEWQRYVPLGICGKQVRTSLLSALSAAAALCLLTFLGHYTTARRSLYQWADGTRELIPGAVMPDFMLILQGSFVCLAMLAACMPALALIFYLFHYHGARSIYTMRRLPNRWELWRRCLALPLFTVAACLAAAILLGLLCRGIYLWATPDICLPAVP